MSTGHKIRVVLADDHTLVRQGFRMILAAQSDLDVVGEAANGHEAVETAARLKPDVVVMDIAMPELNGIEATRRIASLAPEVKVLALTIHDESTYVQEILRAGARGYLLKTATETDLLAAVRSVARGEAYLSPAISQAVLSGYQKPRGADQVALTRREREVLQLIADGKTSKEIATALRLSVYTVDAHRRRMLQKLNLHAIGELVRYAMRNGLMD